MGFDGGGDSLHTENDQSDFDINAGTGLFLSAGTLIRVSDTAPHAFEAQLTVSYKFTWDADDKLGDVNWSHIPIEFMYFYRNKRNSFRFGYGASYYMSSRLEGEGGKSNINKKYENKLGYVLAIEKVLPNQNSKGLVSFGIRYSMRDFTPVDGGPTVNGNAFGLYMTLASFL